MTGSKSETSQPRHLLEAEELHHDVDEFPESHGGLLQRWGLRVNLHYSSGRPGFEVPQVVWVLWAGLIIWATTNAVNVTDGLDGLAGGSALGLWRIHDYFLLDISNPEIYSVVNPRYGRVAHRSQGHASASLVERSSCPNLHGRRRSARH